MGDSMVSKLARRVRCSDVLSIFTKNNKGLCFLTLTTRDVVTIHEIRERWRNLRHYLVEREGDMKYVMNYELHPKGHGWHIHAVFNKYINLRRGGVYQLRRYGFGMISIKKVDNIGVAEYLSKHCLKAYRGCSKELQGQSKRLRLVNCSRGLPVLSDYRWQSAFCDRVRRLQQSRSFQDAFGKFRFALQYKFAEFATLQGWTLRRLVSETQKHINEKGVIS